MSDGLNDYVPMHAHNVTQHETPAAQPQVQSLNATISELIAYRFALREATKELLAVAEEMPAYAYDERGHEAAERKAAAIKKVKEVLENTVLTASPEPWFKPYQTCDYCGAVTHDERWFGKKCFNDGGFMREACRGTFRPNPLFEKPAPAATSSEEVRSLARSCLYGVMGYLGISEMTDEAVNSVAERFEAALQASRCKALPQELVELSEKARPQGRWTHDKGDARIFDARGFVVANTMGGAIRSIDEHETNAEFIVACVNWVRERLAEQGQ